jgi:formylglycine-generating enzyme required for sulfatase activity
MSEQRPPQRRIGEPHWPRRAMLAMLLIVTAAALWYSTASRAVIISPQAAVGSEPLDPALAIAIDIDGWALKLGGNYLMLPGDYTVTVTAPGYQPSQQAFTVNSHTTLQQPVTLRELPGTLELLFSDDNGQPITAGSGELVVNGNAVAWNTSIELPRGRHQLRVELDRYRPIDLSVELSGRGVRESRQLRLVPAWSVRTIFSQPSGASLRVDGVVVGTTPIAAELLDSGSDVELRLDGFETWRDQVTAGPGSERELRIALEPAKAPLRIASQPAGAAVTLNRHYLGTTPLSTRAAVGASQLLSVRLPGYQHHEERLTVADTSPIELDIALQAALGYLQLNLNVAGASIAVDGTERIALAGRSERLALATKPLSLTIAKAGYQSYTLQVEPIADRTQARDIELLTHAEAFWASRPQQLTSSVGARLRLIRPPGSVTMGAGRREPGRRANEGDYRARLSRPFYLGETEVTNRQFKQWREYPPTTVGGAPLGLDEQPAVNISWLQAAQFCNWLSDQEGLPRFYQISGEQLIAVDWDATGYRLPTEAEWAYAARSDGRGNSLLYSWANQLYPPTETVANFADRSAAALLPFTLGNYLDQFMVSAPVASFAANRLGLFDMDGNVSEWVNDFYSTRPNAASDDGDSVGPRTGEQYVYRGASWALAGRSELRLAYRQPGSDGAMDIGLRLARFVDRRGVGPQLGEHSD